MIDSLYERRKYIRWTYTEPIQIRRMVGTYEPYHGTLAQDLSIGGTRIRLSRFLPKATKVSVEGVIPENRARFAGIARVAWTTKLPFSDDQYLVGLEFVELSEDSQRVVQQYLQRQKV